MRYMPLLFCLLIHAAAAGQKPPKVGIALSGGGAKGLAHIGILKAIDSAGLQIDLVTGTSMGSIVGGLYAAGYSADSIEQLARQIDWRILLSNSISMRSYTMEEKSEYGKYAAELTIQKGKVGLPTGFLESQELWLKLQELFYPVSPIKDFNKLPRPYRCIGTDLATGEAVVLQRGDIVSAIRSSMAIPGVFSSVDIDGKRLVDGGVVRNFPVKDVIDMGATYTIGVSVSSPLLDVKELDNAFKILTQVVFLNENKDRIQESKLCNLLIDVPMGDFTSASFNRSNEIIDLGIEVGRQYYPYFKKLADSLGHTAPNVRVHEQGMQQQFAVNRIWVSGLPTHVVEAFYDQLNLPVPGTYTAADITEGLRSAFAYRMYKNITYTLDADELGGYTLVCRATPEAEAMFKAGIHFNQFSGFNVIGNLTLRNKLLPSSRTLLSLNLGQNFRGMAEHLQQFGYRNPWSNRTQVYAEFQDIPFKENFRQLGGYSYRYYRIDNQLMNSARRRWSGGFGARFEQIGIDPTIQSGQYLDGNNRFMMWYGNMVYNSFDKPFFPAKGFKMDWVVGYVTSLNPKLELYNGNTLLGNLKDLGIGYGNYLRTTLDAQRVMPLSSRWTLINRLQAGINFGPYQSLLNDFTPGGMNNVIRNQINFAGLREGDLLSESIAAWATAFRWNVFGDAYITLTGNAMHYDFIKKENVHRPPAWLGGGGLTLGYNLPIGPFEYTVMYGGRGPGWSTYINVGFPFKAQ